MVTVVTGNPPLNMVPNKGMVRDEDFSVHLEELSDLKVTVVSQYHQEGKHLVSKEGVTVTRGSPASMEGDIHAAQGVRVGSFRLGPRLLIRVTTKPTVAGLEIQPPTNRLV